MSTATRAAVRWEHALTDHVECLAVAPSGAVAAGSLGGDAVVLDGASGASSAELAEHPMGVLVVAWSRTGDLLAVGGQDGITRLYAGGVQAGEVHSRAWVGSLAWSPSADILAMASGRRVLLIEPDGAVRAEWPELASTITSLAWSVDGKRIGAGCYGGVTWYDPDEPTDHVRRFERKGSVLALEVAPSGRWLAAGNQDNSVRVWKLWSADDMEMTGYPGKVTRLGFDRTSRWLAVANLTDTTVWDFSGRGPQGTKPTALEAHVGEVTALAWHPTEALLATGGSDGQVATFAAGRSFRLLSITPTAGAAISHLAWSPASGTLIAAAADGSVVALDHER
jgi:WD40 repeat protein